jgi:magnesium transporter
MITAFVRFSDGRISTEATAETIKQAIDDPKAVFWVDLESPTEEEQALLADVFHFHPLAIEDTRHHLQRPKIEGYRRNGHEAFDYFYIVVHAPDPKRIHEHECPEIDIFLTDRYLVTIHDPPMDATTHVRERVKTDPALALSNGVDMLLHAVLDYAVDQYQPILDELDEALDDIEDRAVNNPAAIVLGDIAMKKRELMYMRRIVGPQREVIAQLTRGEVPFVRESTRIYLRDVQDHLVRVYESLELYRDLVQGARDLYLSSISNNLNQIMKTLTIISVIAMPLSVVTSFFGMNFDEPLFHNHNVFIGALIFMGCAIATMLYVFHRRRWI